MGVQPAPSSRFSASRGRHAVEVLSAYLNPAEDVRLLRAAFMEPQSGSAELPVRP